jgi:hypothetical protein
MRLAELRRAAAADAADAADAEGGAGGATSANAAAAAAAAEARAAAAAWRAQQLRLLAADVAAARWRLRAAAAARAAAARSRRSSRAAPSSAALLVCAAADELRWLAALTRRRHGAAWLAASHLPLPRRMWVALARAAGEPHLDFKRPPLDAAYYDVALVLSLLSLALALWGH